MKKESNFLVKVLSNSFIGVKFEITGRHQAPKMLDRFLLMVAVAAAAAKSPQSCPTLCDPIDGSPPGSPFLGILQARTLEWVAIRSL